MNTLSRLLDQPYFDDFIDKFYDSRVLDANTRIAIKKPEIYTQILSYVLRPHRPGKPGRAEFRQVSRKEFTEFVEDNVFEVEANLLYECLNLFVSYPEKYPLPQKIELVDIVAEKMGSNIRYSKDRRLDDLITLFHQREEYFKIQGSKYVRIK